MIDTEHTLKDAGAVTSSGYGTIDSVAKTVDLGEGLVRMNLIIDISFIKCSAADELYTLYLMGGDDESFTETVSLCSKELGAPASLQGNLVSKISRVVIPAQNEQGGTIYPYVRLRYVISGTNPSINLSARLEKDLWYEGWTSLATTTTV
jgi:hypothetical protein